MDSDNSSRHVGKAFNVTTDWTRVEITLPADTTGTLDDDNAASIDFSIHLHNGSTFTSGTLQETWGALAQANRGVGGSSILDSTSRTFFITGVQLEIGQNETVFEHEPFERTLNKCYRYFLSVARGRGSARGSATGGQQLAYSHALPVQMRASPTITHVGVERSGCSHEGYTNTNVNHVAALVDVSSTSYWYYNDGYTAESEL
jgi:hypothetical protein